MKEKTLDKKDFEKFNKNVKTFPKEKTLSEKVHKWKGFYNEKDVKEAVSKLKEEFNPLSDFRRGEIFERVDKIFGSFE